MNTRIRAVRNDAGMTQEEFAKRLGLSRQYIALVETGDRDPSPRTVNDICREFDVPHQWLTAGVGQMHGDTSREAEVTREVGKLFRKRPDSFKAAVISCLMKFDPDGDQWKVLEQIFDGIEKERNKKEE